MRNVAAVIAAIAVWFFVLYLVMLLLGLLGAAVGSPEALIVMVVALAPALWVGRRLWPRASSEHPA